MKFKIIVIKIFDLEYVPNTHPFPNSMEDEKTQQFELKKKND